MSVSKRMSETR